MRLRSLLFVVSVFAVACGGGDGSTDAGARPSSEATVAIVQPEAGAVFAGPEVVVEVDLEGGEIVEETSRDLNATEGHLHVVVDGRVVSQTFGLTQTIEVDEPGRHILQVEFVAKDHGPFTPRVLASVPFEVGGPGG